MKTCVFTGIVFVVAACSTMVSAAPTPAPNPSESLLVPRASKAAKEAMKKIGPAIEKFVLNPQSMTDRDQRAKNRNDAIEYVTGTGGRVSSGRHPGVQKAMDEARKNAYKPPEDSGSKSSKK